MPQQRALPTCRCGHDRHHHMVGPRGRYTLIGWLTLFMGATARPKLVEYWCRRCGEKVDETAETEVLAKHC